MPFRASRFILVMDGLTIRLATPADAELIANMSRETFYNAFAPDNTEANMEKFMNEVFTRERLMDELNLPNNIFLLAYIDNKPAGYVRMRDKAIPEAELGSDNIIEIARIYTISDHIGKGIGTELIHKCISLAKEKQRIFIWLGVWEKNLKGIRFYERFGFKKFGEHLFVLGDDIQTDLLMMKNL